MSFIRGLEDWKEYKNGFVSEMVHCMNETNRGFWGYRQFLTIAYYK